MRLRSPLFVFSVVLLIAVPASAAPRKAHSVTLGAFRTVPYSRAADPAGALPDEASLSIRPLVIDGEIKEWTTGESHNITDRTFVVRRVLRINDELPGDTQPASAKQGRWVWQRGPWLLVERRTGHITALKLPDYDPGVSQLVWFRDYGAYCGVTASRKSLYAVVAQLAVRKPVLAKKLASLDSAPQNQPPCSAPQWQREPFQVTFHPAGMDPVTFAIAPGSAMLVEDAGDEAEAAKSAKSD